MHGTMWFEQTDPPENGLSCISTAAVRLGAAGPASAWLHPAQGELDQEDFNGAGYHLCEITGHRSDAKWRPGGLGGGHESTALLPADCRLRRRCHQLGRR